MSSLPHGCRPPEDGNQEENRPYGVRHASHGFSPLPGKRRRLSAKGSRVLILAVFARNAIRADRRASVRGVAAVCRAGKQGNLPLCSVSAAGVRVASVWLLVPSFAHVPVIGATSSFPNEKMATIWCSTTPRAMTHAKLFSGLPYSLSRRISRASITSSGERPLARIVWGEPCLRILSAGAPRSRQISGTSICIHSCTV